MNITALFLLGSSGIIWKDNIRGDLQFKNLVS